MLYLIKLIRDIRPYALQIDSEGSPATSPEASPRSLLPAADLQVRPWAALDERHPLADQE